MKYISVTEENFEKLQEVTEDTNQDLQMVLQYLNEHNFKINEEGISVFCNHLLMMITRFQKRTLAVVDIDESVITQIKLEYMEMAKGVLSSLYKKYQLPQCLVEEVLLAIYFQTNMEEEGHICQTNH